MTTIGNVELIPKYPTESFVRITKIRPDEVDQLVQRVAKIAQETRDRLSDIYGVWSVEMLYSMDEARFRIYTTRFPRGTYCSITYEGIYLDMIKADNESGRTEETVRRILEAARDRV